MKLHEHEDLFKELIIATAQQMGLPEIYIEKDYWVTHVLKNLSSSELADIIVFKGGTSLSKAHRLIDRFSEDVDLAIFESGLSQNDNKKRLKKAEEIAAEGLNLVEGDERESKGSKYRKTVHQYPRMMSSGDFGQASSELLIEVNSFTHPEPNEKLFLQSYIAERLQAADRVDVIKEYELEEFPIRVLSVKRTLLEKILGAIKDSHDDALEQRLSNRIRHLYDICLILKDEEFKTFTGSDEFRELCINCIQDEKAFFPATARLFDEPLSAAPLFSSFAQWRTTLETTYTTSFKNLVYKDLPHLDEIHEALEFIAKALKKQDL